MAITGHIFDEAGRHIAFVRDDRELLGPDQEIIGSVVDGQMFSLDGRSLGYLGDPKQPDAAINSATLKTELDRLTAKKET